MQRVSGCGESRGAPWSPLLSWFSSALRARGRTLEDLARRCRAVEVLRLEQLLDELGVVHCTNDVADDLRKDRRLRQDSLTSRPNRKKCRSSVWGGGTTNRALSQLQEDMRRYAKRCAFLHSALVPPRLQSQGSRRTWQIVILWDVSGVGPTLRALSGWIFWATRRCSRMYIISPPRFITISGIPSLPKKQVLPNQAPSALLPRSTNKG